MIILLSIVAILALSVFFFMQRSEFGKAPSGKRLDIIKQSENYRNGSFENQSPTAALAEDASFITMMIEFFAKKDRISPSESIPSQKVDLLKLDINEDVLVWFGHSSYFMQLDGKRMLVDPVLSKTAAPVSFAVKAFDGTVVYTVEDIPAIDYLFISHDHWDHLDYQTVTALKSRIGKVVCGLGVGEHFEYWGFGVDNIIEKDWGESVILDDNLTVFFTPARHFSGRSFKRNMSLWTSFVLQTSNKRIFIGGDGGYDSHFAKIGEAYGPFDLAILENGQYDVKWPYIHMQPHQVLQAAKDLQAKRVFPVHSGKFVLANHAWDAPLRTITELNGDSSVSLVTPMIGEKVWLNDSLQTFSQWWTQID